MEYRKAKAFFRIFPTEDIHWEYLKVLNDHKTIYVRCPQDLAKSRVGSQATFYTFCTDEVFYNNSQSEIYNSIMPEVIDKVMVANKNAIIIAFGQTGTGKSSTITGVNYSFQDRGILPRAIVDLMDLKTSLETKVRQSCVQISHIEFMRKGIVDLLKPPPNATNSCKDITKIKIKTAEEALKLLFIGEGRKQYGSISKYQSHTFSSILTFHITTKYSTRGVFENKLHVIDMAGADTIGNLSCFFKNPQEIATANLAKWQLEQFFVILAKNIPDRTRMNQRVNHMVQYLGESLNSDTLLRLIGHLSAAREDVTITHSILRFGQLVADLKYRKYEMKSDNSTTNNNTLENFRKLQGELKRIKNEQIQNKLLFNQGLDKSLNEDRLHHVERTVQLYIQNKITSMGLINVAEMNTALQCLKDICKANEAEKDQLNVSSHSKSDIIASQSMSSSAHKVGSQVKTQTIKDKKSLISIKTDSLKESKTSSTHNAIRRKRSSASSYKRTSSSIISESKLRVSRAQSNLLADLEKIPEYEETWNDFITEQNSEYIFLKNNYDNNENEAKQAYSTYLEELNKVREATSTIEKCKLDVKLAQMTRQFQNLEENKNSDESTEVEEYCIDKLELMESEFVQLQESALKVQSELKSYLDQCRDIKRTLQNTFQQYCMRKFNIPVGDLQNSSGMKIDDVFTTIEPSVSTIIPAFDNEEARYESYKRLASIEREKGKRYKSAKRAWIM